MTSLTIHSHRRVSLIKAYLMAFQDLIKYVRARAKIAPHQNKSHIKQDLQISILSCHNHCLFLTILKKQKREISTKPTFPFLPCFTLFFPSSLNSYKKIHICMINKFQFYTYTHKEEEERGWGEWGAWKSLGTFSCFTNLLQSKITIQDTVKQVYSHQRLPHEASAPCVIKTCLRNGPARKEGAHNPTH